MNFLKKNSNFLILTVFVVLSLIVGFYHEPWSDEAQSWLIAREQSVKDIIFYNASYEGCFPLWILIVKVFISFGLSYEYINIISTLLASIGVYILLNKTNLDGKMKIILPFTFFVFYQYNIIARNYSLFIIAFACLISLYDKRHDKKVRYFLMMMLFSMISIHGMLISGALFFEYLVEEINFFKQNDKKINKKSLWLSIGLILIYLFEIYILIPKVGTYIPMNFEEELGSVLFHILVKICAFTSNFALLFLNIIPVIFLSIVFIRVKILNKKSIAFTIMEILMVIMLIVIRAASHHIGILFLIILAEILLNKKEDNIIKYMTLIVLGVYAILTLVACLNEITGNYSGAKDMAKFIKSIDDFEEATVYAVGYKTTAILPYFEENIYDNRSDAYYLWSTENSEWVFYNYSDYVEVESIFKDKEYPKYILIQNHDLTNRDKRIRAKIEKSGLYNLKYESLGNNFYKASSSEIEGYVLYEIKEN